MAADTCEYVEPAAVDDFDGNRACGKPVRYVVAFDKDYRHIERSYCEAHGREWVGLVDNPANPSLTVTVVATTSG